MDSTGSEPSTGGQGLLTWVTRAAGWLVWSLWRNEAIAAMAGRREMESGGSSEVGLVWLEV